MKVTIRIHNKTGLEFKKRKLQDNMTVILEKPKRRTSGWIAKIRDLEVQHLRLGRVKYYADIWQDAKESWMYDYDKHEVNRPMLTMDQVKQFAKTESFKWHFQGKPQGPSSIAIWLVLAAVVVMGIINLLVATRRLII